MSQPRQLRLVTPDTLEISWTDGATRRYPVAELRNNCPCATCQEKKRGKQGGPAEPVGLLPVITVAETEPLRITHMEPMGRYAYAIHFSDGHDTGLFTLEALRQLGSVLER